MHGFYNTPNLLQIHLNYMIHLLTNYYYSGYILIQHNTNIIYLMQI